jgi:DNA-binding transcriptional regulator YiaG
VSNTTASPDLSSVVMGRRWLRTGDLERLRVALGLSRGELARRLGVKLTDYSQWVDTERVPRTAAAARVCEFAKDLRQLLLADLDGGADLTE